MRSLFKATLFFSLIAGGCDCDNGELIDARAILVVEPLAVDFGEVVVGGQRIASFKLSNRGLSNLRITQFTLEGSQEIAFATPPPETLGPEQSIDFNLVFEPVDVGEETATITIFADDAPDEAKVVTAVGIGVQAGVGLTHDGEACGEDTSSLSFGSAAPGETVDRTITVTADGSATVTILSAIIEPGSSPEFTIEALAQPTDLAPGESLSLVATYAPQDGGPDSGAIVVTTNAADAPSLRVAVCGTGAAPAICATPQPLNLGAVVVGGTLNGTLTVESCGPEPVTVSAVQLSNDPGFPTDTGFTLAGVPGLPLTMQPGETFDLDIGLTTQQLGVHQGHVQVTSTALGNEEAFFVATGRGAQPCDLVVAPAAITYSNVAVGATDARNVLVANNGSSDCTITNVEITQGAPPFSTQPLTLPITVGPGQSQTITVEYMPTQSGTPDMGRLEIEEGGVITPVDLLGNPDLSDGCFVDVAPPIMNFGAVAPGTTRSMGVDVTNIGQDPCFLTGVSLTPGSDPDFIETSQNFGLIFPGSSKQLSITYSPSAAGSATGIMEIETSDSVVGGTRTITQVPIFAAAAESGICVDPLHLGFGPTPGTATMDFTIYACGSFDVTVTALDWTTADSEFTLLSPPAMPFTLAPGSNQSVTVQYTSADTQGDTGVVTVRSDDPVNPAIDVTVTGGPEIVPPSAGRFLYYWQIPNVSGGDIMQLPLQGVTVTQPFWGPRTGQACAGCHTLSPDGRYVALIEAAALKVVDTRTNVALSLPSMITGTSYFSWNPDVNTNPPYQYVYDNGSDVKVGALFVGELRTLVGADDPNFFELMPTWGSSGKIAFARGTTVQSGGGGGNFGFQGVCDILLVDEAGGVPELVVGASGNNAANYYPTFSPNGQWIAYTFSAAAQGSIAATDAVLKMASVMNTGVINDMPNANNAPGAGASSFPTWAVDGSYISFASNRAGGAGDWDLYVAPIDPTTGTDGPAVNVVEANTAGFEHGAQWSP